jgi:hypothetical protein
MRERPFSVTLIGILNIGFGLLGLGGVLLSKMFEGLDSVSTLVVTLSHHPGYLLWNKITLPLNIASCLLLVAAGAGLLLLKNWARLASIGWGIYKVLFTFLNTVVLCCLGLREVAAQAMEVAGAVGIAILGVFGLVATVLALAYPVLLIYFLTRPKAARAFQPELASPL